MASDIDTERKEHYIGKKRNFLRDGYGTYVYENTFFRYEGQWVKGKKHGHGKLIMKDGTYYEGQFINGEINGNGYKFFATSRAKYTGQFVDGEMRGNGTMVYDNCNVYEGQWYKNMRHGYGILRSGEIPVSILGGLDRVIENSLTYDGTYQNLSNGDKYEGYWVMDKKQGHGELFCADGTHYVGQYMNDLFNGEGAMSHASGMVYRGLWHNGFPVLMATKIVILVDESPLIIRQGRSFSIKVECRNDEDELVEDQGRELQVIVGFRYTDPMEGSVLFDIIEDVEDTPIYTPFYDVVPYPLTDQLPEAESIIEPIYKTLKSPDSKLDEGLGKEEDEGEDNGLFEVSEAAAEDAEGGVISGVIAVTKSFDNANDEETVGEETALPDDQDTKDDEETSHILTSVQPKPSVHGMCEWRNLQLAPPPPMYRPFVILEEEARRKLNKSLQGKDKFDEYEEAEDDAENLETEFEEFEEIINEVIKDVSVEVTFDLNLEEESFEAGRKSTQIVIQQTPKQSANTILPEEKFARPGEYILIVQDVTNPPFLNRPLESAYLVLKLKKIAVKKAKHVCRFIDDDKEEEECVDEYFDVSSEGLSDDREETHKNVTEEVASVVKSEMSISAKSKKSEFAV